MTIKSTSSLAVSNSARNVRVLPRTVNQGDLAIAEDVASRGLYAPTPPEPAWMHNPAHGQAQQEFQKRTRDLKNFLDFSDSSVPPETAQALVKQGAIRTPADAISVPDLPVGTRVEFDFEAGDGSVQTTRGIIALTTPSSNTILATDEKNRFATFTFPSTVEWK